MNESDYKYDLAVSFAGEHRQIAEAIVSRLDASGYSVFYDDYHQAELWGRELAIAFKEIYADQAHFCLILLSREYVTKAWTDFERKNAISRCIKQRGDYVLCLKIDDIDLPGFPGGIAYISMADHTVDDIYRLLLQKLGTPIGSSSRSRLTTHDKDLALQVVKACFRRAVYTRMDSEIDTRTMYDSIGAAIGLLQMIIPQIQDQALQYDCNEILVHLDQVDRTRLLAPERIADFVSAPIKLKINHSKQQVVQLLLNIRRTAGIPMQLPTALRSEHYFGIDQANGPPKMA